MASGTNGYRCGCHTECCYEAWVAGVMQRVGCSNWSCNSKLVHQPNGYRLSPNWCGAMGLGPCTNKWMGCHCQNTMVSGPNGYRVAHNGVCCYGALGGCTIQWLVCHFQITKLQWPMAPMGIGVGASGCVPMGSGAVSHSYYGCGCTHGMASGAQWL